MISDATFRVISLVAPVVVVAWSVLHYLAVGRKVRAGAPPAGPADVRRLGFIERLVFLVFALTILCLAVTGLGPNLLLGERLEDWALMLHVGAGGAFMLCMLLLAVLWAEDCRFADHDDAWRTACRRDPDRPAPAGRFDAGQKCAFWLTMFFSALTALSMMVSMLPIFSSHGLEVLRDVHRVCGLVVVLVGYLHFYQTVIVRRGRIGWLLSGKVPSAWAGHYHPLWHRAASEE